VAGSAIGWAGNTARWWTRARCRRCRLPGGLGCSTGSPAARHAWKLPSTSVAWAKPVGAMPPPPGWTDNPSSRRRMTWSSSCGARGWRGWLAGSGRRCRAFGGVCARSRGDAIAGDLRIGADVDQGRPSLHGPPGLSRIEPGSGGAVHLPAAPRSWSVPRRAC